MNEKLLNALIDQINAEIYSSYLYLAMAADATHKGYPGCAHWFQIQAQEEMVHAMKFYDYLNERGEKVILKQIEAPQATWDSITDTFHATLEHERKVSGLIRDLYKIAREVFDPATEIFLNWFIMEQVEEEAHASEIIQKLELAQNAQAGLLQLDNELGQRPMLITLNQAAE